MVFLSIFVTITSLEASEKPENKKLKIALLMDQSNMVGHVDPRTAWYLTQTIYLPPAKIATVKSQNFDWEEFYWSGIRLANGSKEYNARGKALLEERTALRKLWRKRIHANFGRNAKANNWDYKKWGEPPNGGKDFSKYMQEYLHKKAEDVDLYKRFVEHIESPENKLHPKVAMKHLARREEPITKDIKRVREIFLKGTKPEDFDKLEETLKPLGKVTTENRMAYANVLKDTINLPIAERTYISTFGEIAGGPANGRLYVGYAKWPKYSGTEYPFGITFERLVDGPVLLIKCALGRFRHGSYPGTNLDKDWRPPSLATQEKPMGELLKKSLANIKTVLSDLGKYHPDYDPKAGYELAGMVWFQGWNDEDNKEYGEQLVSFIKDFRKEMKSPNLPVVCGLLPNVGWKFKTFDGNVNSGILYAAKHPDLKGTVDIVNTAKYVPIELGFIKYVETAFGKESDEYKKAEKIITRSTSDKVKGCYGSAKFAYLTGDAMARKLANLLKGGEPTIQKEAEAILNTK